MGISPNPQSLLLLILVIQFFVLFLSLMHCRLEASDGLAQTLPKFRQLVGAEDEQNNSKDNQQMHRLKIPSNTVVSF